MNDWTVQRAAIELRERQTLARAGGRLVDVWEELDLDVAYETQKALLRHMEQDGDAVVGVKLGLTSPAKQKRMGISTPLTAWLTDAMTLQDGEALSLDGLIHPRVEPEIVFVMGERLEGPGVTAGQALAAVRTVHAGLEVIDSRFADFHFTLPDVVADNASAARFMVSDRGVDPRSVDLAAEACRISLNGVVAETGTGADVQGHPAEALALAVNSLGKRGLALEAGWIILTGGITDAVPFGPGDLVHVEFANLGALTMRSTGSTGSGRLD